MSVEDEGIFNVDVTADKTAVQLQELLALIAANKEKAIAAGDTLRVIELEVVETKAALGAAASSPVSATSAERTKANTLAKATVDLDTEDMAVLRAQNQALIETAAIRARLQSAGPLIVPTGTARYSAVGPTAGAQVAVEEQQAATAAALAAQREAALAASASIVLPAAVTRSYGAGEPNLGQQAAIAERQQITTQAINQAIAQRQSVEADSLDLAQIQLINAALDAETAKRARIVALIKEAASQSAYQTGAGLAAGGVAASKANVEDVTAIPAGLAVTEWTAEDIAAQKVNLTLGQYRAYAADASIATEQLTTNTLRLGMVQAQASNSLRAHGALTTEYISALARGETTINELGYQMGATIAKFGGWAAAAALTYGALGAVVEFGKGAIDAASAVQQLTRTIPNLDKTQTSSALQGLAAGVNVPIKEAGDATFLMSRTFHDVGSAVTAAGLALKTFKLDGVAVADSVKMLTALHVQLGLSAQDLVPIYDRLATGQRVFAARTTEMIPLLQRSVGAIKNAGGDFNEYLKIATIFLSTTQLPGAQVGTMLQRAAQNYLNPATPKGQKDLATLQTLGIDTSVMYKAGSGGITTLLNEMLAKSKTMSDADRAKMTIAFGGTGYGGRGSAVWGGSGAALQPRVTTAFAGSRGALDEEFKRELGTASQRLKAFLYDIQDLGAAFANTGALKGFSALLWGLGAAVNAARVLVDEFDKMPSVLRNVISGLIELRLLMLFISRTRIGGSIPGISKVPLFRPSEDTQARQTIALANRPVITNLESDVSRTSASLGQTTARISTLQSELAQANAAIVAGGEGEAAAIEAQVAVAQQIKDLTLEQTELQKTLVFQKQALATAEARQVTVTASNRITRMPGEEARTQVAAMQSDSAAVTTTTTSAVSAEATLAEAQVRADAAYATALALQTKATEAVGVASAEDAAALQVAANAAAATALSIQNAVSAERKAAVTIETAAAETETVGGTSMLGGLATGIGGLAMALDPLTVGLVALPIAWGVLNSAGQSTDQALQAAIATVNQPVTTLTQLPAHIAALNAAIAARQKAQDNPTGVVNQLLNPKASTDRWLSNALHNTADWVGNASQTIVDAGANSVANLSAQNLLEPSYRRGAGTGAYKPPPAAIPPADVGPQGGRLGMYGGVDYYKPQDLTQVKATDVGLKNAFAAADAQAKKDATNAKDTQAGRDSYYAQMRALAVQIQKYAASHPGVDTLELYRAAKDQQAGDLAAANAQFFQQARPDQALSTLEGLTDAQLQTQVQAYSAQAQAQGLSGQALQMAIQTALYTAAKYRGSQDPTQLGLVTTALNTMTAGITGQVTSMQQAAASASTIAGRNVDLSSAVTIAQQGKAQIDAAGKVMERQLASIPGAAKEIRDLIDKADQTLGPNAATQIQNMLTAMQGDSATTVAAIPGISPEADLQRSQAAITGASGLTDQLATLIKDKADPTTIQKMRDQIATANNAQAKSMASYADSLGQAQGQLASASIMGITPEADLARTRADLATANGQLARDKASGAGGIPKQITDQANIDTATNKLMQGIQSYDQTLDDSLASFITAQTALAASKTTDPVAKANIELAGAKKLLTSKKPADFKTHQDYETWLMGIQANINSANTTKLDAWVTQQEATDKFLLSTQQISNTEFIARLKKLQQTRNLSLTQSQTLTQEIFDASKSSAVNLNVGAIKLPSTYEVRRAIAAAHHGRQSIGTAVTANVTNTNTYNIIVHKTADARKVVDMISKAASVSTQSTAQSMGMV